MSLLIKGLKMPKGCLGCPCINAKYNECMILQRRTTDVMTRMTDCPLIELPDHGDLIDREETAHEMWMKECYECNRVYDNNGCKGCAVTRMINVIACAETAPAVIPAERSEDA